MGSQNVEFDILSGQFTQRLTLLNYRFEQRSGKSSFIIWSITYVPKLNEPCNVIFNCQTLEFFQPLLPIPRPLSSKEATLQRLHSLMKQEITDNEMRCISLDSEQLKRNLKDLVSEGAIIYDEVTKSLRLPVPIPQSITIKAIRELYSRCDFHVLYVSLNGMLHYEDTQRVASVTIDNKLHKVYTLGARKVSISDNDSKRVVISGYLLNRNVRTISRCSVQEFPFISLENYKVIIYLNCFVYRPDIPVTIEQFCCDTFLYSESQLLNSVEVSKSLEA